MHTNDMTILTDNKINILNISLIHKILKIKIVYISYT